jgi:hypothetical protein
MSRKAALTPLSQRLTSGEVATLWFRRGAELGAKIHKEYCDFPQPGPDGLYLLTQVTEWFDRWHGHKQRSAKDAFAAQTAEALRIAEHGGR